MYQQKIPLRGSEASLNLFTELLRELKGATANSSSADVLLAAVLLWRDRPSTLKAVCTASSRCDGQTHAFHLQGITTHTFMENSLLMWSPWERIHSFSQDHLFVYFLAL